MLQDQTFPAHAPNATPPRAIGALALSSKKRDSASCIDSFRASGSARAVFPRSAEGLEAVVVNTSGGLTGGDRFRIGARAGAGSHLILTTQAAERAYRSASGLARVSTHLEVEPGASLFWLPQELIVFDGAALTRKLEVTLAEGAELLLVEPVIFGRALMGEVVQEAIFRDRVTITRAGRPLYSDAISLTGDIPARLSYAATARGMTAMASVVLVRSSAEGLLTTARSLLPEAAGASLLAPDMLVIRLLAQDGYLLRAALCPLLEALSGADLPKSWRL